MTLLNLKIGQVAELKGVDQDARCYNRLLELGFVAGESIKLVRKAPLGGPIQVQIRGTHYAIRLSDARLIHVE